MVSCASETFAAEIQARVEGLETFSMNCFLEREYN